MRVVVCGSRTWTRQTRILSRLSALPDDAVILQGCAAGADLMAKKAAIGLGLEVEDYPADWKKYGKIAGFIRNIDMLEAHADLVIAFWDGESKGTQHTLNEAKKRGIPIEVVYQ